MNMNMPIIATVALTMGLTACVSTNMQENLSKGLVAHYAFNGNANDSSGNGNNGIVHEATLATDRFGNENSAYSFAGRHWIKIPNSHSLQSVTNTMTYSAWVKWEKADGGWMPVLCKGTRHRQFSFELTKGDQIFINDHNGTGSGKKIAVTLADGTLHSNEWCHIAATYNGTEMIAYINGVKVGNTLVEDRFVPDNSPMYIGLDPPEMPDHYFGALDDIRIYNRVLSESEIVALYNAK